jgi:hypothetical protein
LSTVTIRIRDTHIGVALQFSAVKKPIVISVICGRIKERMVEFSAVVEPVTIGVDRGIVEAVLLFNASVQAIPIYVLFTGTSSYHNQRNDAKDQKMLFVIQTYQ